RTVAIDIAVRQAAALQVVILGAGLDGRAWRMPELRDAIVFEIDHPDSQRQKQARVGALTRAAKDVRFVPVDFAVDDLDTALKNAGHDTQARTMWIWEGVVMYLTLEQIEAALRVIRARSAPGSRLAIVYHAPALLLLLVGWVVKRVGEPLRSVFRAPQMQALLARHGFRVVSDADLPTIAAQLTPEIADLVGAMRQTRIVIAEAG
ncbi:MAG: SAM-dependent methyltransferase, partial [Pseudomonadota bacterium]